MTVEYVQILGVRIENRSMVEAVELLARRMTQPGTATAVFIVNAHTLNLAAGDPQYRDALARGDYIFGDGVGVRWAARMRGARMASNLVGTDLVPELLDATSGRGHRLFLLGGDSRTLESAAAACEKRFPGWQLAGTHDGYFGQDHRKVIDTINRTRPSLLLVGMGNPLQESWLARYRDQLEVPVCIGVGGLFHHWGGDLARASLWVRRASLEWLQILLQQPHKWRRYLLGNPLFLWRVARTRRREALRSKTAERRAA